MFFYGIAGAIIFPLLIIIISIYELIPEAILAYITGAAALSNGFLLIPILAISSVVGFVIGMSFFSIKQIILDGTKKI